MNIQEVISSHSNYQSEDPHWFSLCRDIENEDLRKALSDSLNVFFERHGPDANEAFYAFESCLMTRRTAERALKYAFLRNKKATKDIDFNRLIDGGFSLESDGRVNDPVTGKLLHCIPINADSTIDELNCLQEQDKLYRDDWVFIDYAYNSFRDNNPEVLKALLGAIEKHHKF